MNVGGRIKEKREAQAMTQEALAEAVQVTRSMICQIERGNKMPTVSLAYEIAEALGCKLDDFIK